LAGIPGKDLQGGAADLLGAGDGLFDPPGDGGVYSKGLSRRQQDSFSAVGEVKAATASAADRASGT
jgi:hypothetical protein